MKYLLVRDGGVEHLLGLADSQSRSIASSASRLDLYAALVKDAGLSVVELDCGGSVVMQKQKTATADTEGGVCGFCHQQKIKDGVTAKGAQRWRCPQPHNARQQTRGARATRRGAGKKRSKRGGRDFASNPKCPNCSKTMNVTGRHRGVTYYKCKNGCPARGRGEGWSSLNLPTSDGLARDTYQKVEALVAQVNGHDPALRGDIVQEIMLDLELKKILFNELDRETIRRYIRSQTSLGQRKGRDVSLDTPIGDGDLTVADTLRATETRQHDRAN